MAWFKIDDSFPSHPKVLSIPRKDRLSAIGLWTLAGSWCAKQLTDGYLAGHMVEEIGGTRKSATLLVDVGLWEVVDSGYQFHDWDEYQPTRTQVENERLWNRRRAELHRDGDLIAAIRRRDQDRCRYCGIAVSFKARRGPTAGTYDHVIPRGPNNLDGVVVACGPCNGRKGPRTPDQAGMPLLPPGSMGNGLVSSRTDLGRIQNGSDPGSKDEQDPVPSRPDPTSSSSGTTSGAAEPVEQPARIPRSRGAGTRIPDPFIVDEAMKDWAVDRGFTAEWCMQQTERFINYWTAKPGKDGTKSDWRATWRNWILKASDVPYSGQAATRRPNGPDPGLFDRAMERAQQRLEIVQ